jgi:hypothetical protein
LAASGGKAFLHPTPISVPQTSVPVAVSFAPSLKFRDHVMTTLINVIRQLARRFVDDGWLPLAVLSLVVFWMMHSA